MDIKAILAKLKSLKLGELNEALKGALTEARNIADAVDGAKRDFTTEERATVAELLEGAKQIKARVKELKGDEQMRAAINELGEGIALAADDSDNGKAQKRKSLGKQFVSSAEWLGWIKQMGGKTGRIPDSVKGIHSPAVKVNSKHLLGRERKELITGLGDASAGVFIDTDQTGIYEPLGRFPLNLRDLVSVRDTDGDTVEFVRQVTQVNAAAPVPEANVTTFTGATGEVSGLKPEGSMSFERVTEVVKTIAVWIPATKRALSDAAQLRGLIDQELREDLNEELENQMLNGNGIGENFTGLANTADTLVQAWNTDLITTTRKALTNLLVNGKTVPTGWLLNPVDWEAIELLKDAENRYYWGGPMSRGQKTLWGVPVAESFYQPAGTAWLGNWSKAVLWDREEANISVSDSHADFFIRNMVAILAELRAAFGVIRPSAFVEVDLDGS